MLLLPTMTGGMLSVCRWGRNGSEGHDESGSDQEDDDKEPYEDEARSSVMMTMKLM